MFEAGVPVGADPALREASEQAFAVLRGAADVVCAAMPAAARPPALMVALHMWAMAHGVASLFGRGDGAQRAMPISAEELLEADMLVYLRGLGVNAARTSAASAAQVDRMKPRREGARAAHPPQSGSESCREGT